MRSALMKSGSGAVIATALIACVLSASPAQAGPEGGEVVAGAAVIETGAAATITQTTDRAIINWREFSIAAGESVRFIQPDAGAITLNRVIGGNISEIYGSLTANGRLLLINPQGVLFGAGARIDVGGLVASTADIADSNFLAGNFVFDRPGAPAASIINEGEITVSDAGLLAFVAPHVRNSGIISARLGRVALAAGSKYTLDLYGDDLVSLALDADVFELAAGADGEPVAALVESSGLIDASGGRILISARAARGLLDTIILADGAHVASSARAEGGVIILDGGSEGGVAATGVFDASGASGGDIRLRGARVFADGLFRADGLQLPASGGEGAAVASWRGMADLHTAAAPETLHQSAGAYGSGGRIDIDGSRWVSIGGGLSANGGTGGAITVRAGELSFAGAIAARGLSGAGGTIDLESLGKTLAFSSATADASGADGGFIRQVAGTQLTTSARYAVRGETGAGGALDMTAPVVKLLSAQVDASGETSGGSVRIGGEFQGGKDLAVDELANARTLIATTGTGINVAARGAAGAGGRAILWSDDQTIFLGAVDARPGSVSGAGGFVEISSAGDLTYNGRIAASAPGRPGTVLFDPKNLEIVDGSFNQLSLILGYNYAGSPDAIFGLGRVEAGDAFGAAVSLDGNRLAVGAYGDDGAGGAVSSAGAVYLFSFADAAFNGGVLEAVIGDGYTGGKNVNVPQLDASDLFGTSVSLDGNRLAVGAPGDDGAANSVSESGAAYLFSFSDAAFSGGALEAVLGFGYTGGKNLNLALLEVSDQFGTSVSLDGNRLAAGARLDDGFANAVTDSGAAYLFSFADAGFSSPTFEAIIGAGYTGGKNVNVASLDASDLFGVSVSLDGNRLAVGASSDGGVSNTVIASGAVRLFSFTDAAFGGGALEATLGSGYTGGKNINVTELEIVDQFGWGVSLDGNRLAVAAIGDDGIANQLGNSGGAYLFSFADSAFNGGVLESIIGFGYSGGKNIAVPGLDVNDQFGASISLDGNRLAIGSRLDDAADNNLTDSGAVFLFNFSDAAFNGGALAGRIGANYLGGSNIDLSRALDFSDLFGASVSIDGLRLAVGATWDSGAGITGPGLRYGAVYLFSFADEDFSSPVLEAIIGKDYTGGKNINLPTLGSNYELGVSLSLDGNRLAIGSLESLARRGNVSLFTFTDSLFSGGVLEAIIGNGYLGGKNINVPQIQNSDYFGYSGVSLDGNRLAVGAFGDDGAIGENINSGAVYLFTFADAAFSGGALQATIGSEYTGGKNFNFGSLPASSGFGYAVSLDGNRLAVGASGRDADNGPDFGAGSVYLFSFSDSAFSGATLESSIGAGFTGGKNVNIPTLDDGDYFGQGVSLDGLRLAIGAPLDDGASNAFGDSGAVYLLNFSDLAFNGGYVERIIGRGYSGGSNLDVSNIGLGDRFALSLSLDGSRLAVGAFYDDGFGNSLGNTGAVYLFNFSGDPLDQTFGLNPSSSAQVSVEAVRELLADGTDLTLQANNDITFNGDLIVVAYEGSAGALTLRAGRSIFLNSYIYTDFADFTAIANDSLASGVIDAEREPGPAVIQMGPDAAIDAGTGIVTLLISNDTGKTNSTTGDLRLGTIDAGTIYGLNFGQSGGDVVVGGQITAASEATIVLASLFGDFINLYGPGALDPGPGQFFVYSQNPANNVLGGLVGSPWYNTSFGGSVPNTGNYFVYTLAPSLTVAALPATRVAGDPDPVFGAAISGYLPGDSPASTTGAPLFTTTAGPNSPPGVYPLTPTLGTLASAFNYGFTFANSTLTITASPTSFSGSILGQVANDPPATTEDESASITNASASEESLFSEIESAAPPSGAGNPVYDDIAAGDTSASLAGAVRIDDPAALRQVDIYAPAERWRTAIDWDAANAAINRQTDSGIAPPLPADMSGINAARLPVLLARNADPGSVSVHSAGDSYFASYRSGGVRFGVYGTRVLTAIHGEEVKTPTIFEIVRMEYGLAVSVSVYGAVYQVTMYCHEDHTDIEIEDHDLTALQQAVRELAAVIGDAGKAKP